MDKYSFHGPTSPRYWYAIAFATYKLANARDLPGEAASALATA